MDNPTTMLGLILMMGGALVYGFRLMVTRMGDVTKIMTDMQVLGERVAKLEAHYDQIKDMLEQILERIQSGGRK